MLISSPAADGVFISILIASFERTCKFFVRVKCACLRTLFLWFGRSSILGCSCTVMILRELGRFYIRAVLALIFPWFTVISSSIWRVPTRQCWSKVSDFKSGGNAKIVQITAVVVDGLYRETHSVIRCVLWNSTGCLNLEGTGFALGERNIYVLRLAHIRERKCCVVTTTAAFEWTYSLCKSGVCVGVWAYIAAVC